MQTGGNFPRSGIGGPAALKLSAFGARDFAECGYAFGLRVNWIPRVRDEDFKREILSARRAFPKRSLRNSPLFGLPRSLWEYLCRSAGVSEKLWASFSKADGAALKAALSADEMRAVGKSAHKGEFATCGGLECGCADFKTCSLEGRPTLFFAGECLDIIVKKIKKNLAIPERIYDYTTINNFLPHHMYNMHRLTGNPARRCPFYRNAKRNYGAMRRRETQ